MVWNDKLKREIPEGWYADNICRIADILSGGTPSKQIDSYWQNGNIPFFGPTDYAGAIFQLNTAEHITSDGLKHCASSLFEEGVVIITARGSIGKLVIVGTPMAMNQSCYAFRSRNNEFEYLYFLTTQLIEHLKAKGSGSVFKSIITTDIENSILSIADETTITLFTSTIRPLMSAIKENTKQIEVLTKQRDELLPLLMNGQVSVNYHLSKSYMRQFVYSYYHSLKNTMKQKFIHSVLQELSKVLDSQQLDFVENTLEQKLLDLDVIEQVTNEELVNQENDELLTAFLSAKKIEGCSAKTIKYYKSTINHLFDEIGKTTAEITTNDIRSYLAYYQEQKQSSKVTIDNMRRIFSSFFSWLEDEDYIVKSPVRRIHKVRTDTLVKEVINDECMELLRDNCTEIRDLAMIDLLASTGMRVGELVQMNIDDVDFQERQCKVFGKGNKEREVYFNARAKIHLQQYISQREDENPALFVSFSSPHKRLSISGVEVRLRTLGRRINLPKIHPHKFRRTLATMAIDKGMPIEQVQRLLGHVKIDTTLHYAMVNQNNVKIAHRRYIG